ncbi:alpha/beta-hydrolase [Auriculariales sp. MPI-PUGE-AT-0066]|nr:alpha/beta-hydrolase [Auriculariales sp. MPI-PUGE-AT-0066]
MSFAKLYKEFAETPVPTSAVFLNGSDSTPVIRVTYNVRDHEQNTSHTFNKTLIVTPTGVLASLPEHAQLGIVQSAVSPSKTLMACLREDNGKGSKKRSVEVWRGEKLVARKDVSKAHGDFNIDDFFSCLSFSPSEKALIYCAEANLPEGDSRFVYTPDLGERMKNRRCPTLFLMRFGETGGDLHQLKTREIGVLFGQAVFGADQVIFARGYEYLPDGRLLGIVGCTNRPAAIWRFKILEESTIGISSSDGGVLEGNWTRISEEGRSARSPRVFRSNETNLLVWLSNSIGGAHAGASNLHAFCFDDAGAAMSSRGTTSVTLATSLDFPGLYADFIIRDGFLDTSSGVCIVLQILFGMQKILLLVQGLLTSANPSLCPATMLKGDSPESDNLILLATDGKNKLICTQSHLSRPPSLVLITIQSDGAQLWQQLQRPALSEEVQKTLNSFETSRLQVPGREPVEVSVIHAARKSSDHKQPCILNVRGGPHLAWTTEWNAGLAACVAAGYTVALVNYTGSTGYGDMFVEKLMGRSGDLDVEDCMAAARHLVKFGISEEGPGKQFVIGKSHGGLIGGLLVSKYPDFFTACALSNPVTAVGDMIGVSDIPDWAINEFKPLAPSLPASVASHQDAIELFGHPILSSDEYARLQALSPIAHVDKVKAAVLLMVGDADSRVPMSQSKTLYRALKARMNGPRVEMLVFPGANHAMGGVECERVAWEKTIAWFQSASSAATNNGRNLD